jgi:hypothetical protein
MPEHPDSTSRSSHGDANSMLTNAPSMSGSERTDPSQTGVNADQSPTASLIQDLLSLVSSFASQEAGEAENLELEALITRVVSPQGSTQYNAKEALKLLGGLKQRVLVEAESNGLPLRDSEQLFQQSEQEVDRYLGSKAQKQESLLATKKPEPPQTESAPLFFNPDGC